MLIWAACGSRQANDVPTAIDRAADELALLARVCVDLRAPTLDAAPFALPASSAQRFNVEEDPALGQLLGQASLIPLRGQKTADGNRYIAAARCSGDTCSLQVVRSAAGEPLSEPYPLMLVEEGFGEEGDGLRVEDMRVADIDGDGRHELWLRYESTGKPEPAVGATGYQHVSALALPELTPVLEAHVSTGPGGAAGQLCEGTFETLDVDCDQIPDLVLTQTCGTAMCLGGNGDAECPENELERRRSAYVRVPRSKRYWPLPAQPFQAPAAAPPPAEGAPEGDQD